MRKITLLLGFLLLTMPAAADLNSVVDLVLPQYAGVGPQAATANNQLDCVRIAAWAGGNFTSMAGQMVTGLAGQTCGFGFYPDGDALTGVVVSGTCTGAGQIQAGSLTIPIVAGTMYRLCFCSTSTTPTFLVVNDSGTNTGHFAQLINTFVTTSSGHSANCSGGVPNATTGTLTADQTFRGPPILVFH